MVSRLSLIHILSFSTWGNPTERSTQGASTDEAYWLANDYQYNPVSYTHLAVYKRQVFDMFMKQLCAFSYVSQNPVQADALMARNYKRKIRRYKMCIRDRIK